MKRHPDGRFRGNRAKIELTDKVLISRWVEGEVIRLKRMGLSFEAIAGLLSRAGRGEYVGVSLPQGGVTFPPGYAISKMGCCRAYRRGLDREPSLEAREHRRLDLDRLEDMYLRLQAGMNNGDHKAIGEGVRVLTLKAKIIGYLAPSKTAESEGVEREKAGPKEVAHSEEWDDTKTITMFEQALQLLEENKPTDKKS